MGYREQQEERIGYLALYHAMHVERRQLERKVRQPLADTECLGAAEAHNNVLWQRKTKDEEKGENQRQNSVEWDTNSYLRIAKQHNLVQIAGQNVTDTDFGKANEDDFG